MAGVPQNAYITTGNAQNCLNWDIVSGATSYSVQRSTDGVTFSTVSTPAVNLYLDTAVLPGVLYYYQVASIAAGPITSAYQNIGTNGLSLSIIPSLPGQIPLGYLRQQSKLRADRLNSQFLTNDEWNFNLNQSAFELRDILVSKYGEDYFLAPPLLLPVTGLISYALPNGSNYSAAPALLKLSGIDVNISGGSTGNNAGWVPLARMNWSDRDKYTTFPGQAGALNNVYQMSYRVMGDQLYLFPQNMNQTVRIWYIPIMLQMLLDTDMLPFSLSGWSEYVIVNAAMIALAKEESFEAVAALNVAKQALMTRIEYAAENRDVGQPNTVSNVRATMGDPGFSNWGFGGGGFGGGYGGI